PRRGLGVAARRVARSPRVSARRGDLDLLCGAARGAPGVWLARPARGAIDARRVCRGAARARDLPREADGGRMSELFVVGISWRHAPVAVREKLAFRDDELAAALQAMTAKLPVAEALLVSTCNRVEVYGVGKPSADPTGAVRAFLATQRGLAPAAVADVLYD